MPRQRRGGIAVERRADRRGDLGHRHVLGMQHAVAIVEMVHVRQIREDGQSRRSRMKGLSSSGFSGSGGSGSLAFLRILARLHRRLVGRVEAGLAAAGRNHGQRRQQHRASRKSCFRVIDHPSRNIQSAAFSEVSPAHCTLSQIKASPAAFSSGGSACAPPPARCRRRRCGSSPNSAPTARRRRRR